MRQFRGGVEYRDVGGTPLYTLVVEQRPSSGSKLGKAAYSAAVQEVARREILVPLEADDLEVEILYVSRTGINIDLDNIIRPTLNALTGIAYKDDRQVRSLRAARFDTKKPMRLRGSGHVTDALFKEGAEHRVVVLIYSALEKRWRRREAANSESPTTGSPSGS
jgi:hypothetical protein